MKMTFAALCMSGALAFASGAFAQAASSSSPEEKDMGKSMTVTGCLVEAPGAAGEYELTNVTGKTATSEKSTAGSYKLVAGGNVNLKEHVGHKVEITGTSEKASTSGAAGEEKLKVTNLKHISPSCDAGSTK
jgi:hypothetical protein